MNKRQLRVAAVLKGGSGFITQRGTSWFYVRTGSIKARMSLTVRDVKEMLELGILKENRPGHLVLSSLN